ncbi:hypothetical protein C2E23DRAFT_357103 [Lenzites betulinus]|nr:hypothetical protein C2E23DRAFT_357103 [Lenzites betulinus]
MPVGDDSGDGRLGGLQLLLSAGPTCAVSLEASAWERGERDVSCVAGLCKQSHSLPAWYPNHPGTLGSEESLGGTWETPLRTSNGQLKLQASGRDRSGAHLNRISSSYDLHLRIRSHTLKRDPAYRDLSLRPPRETLRQFFSHTQVKSVRETPTGSHFRALVSYLSSKLIPARPAYRRRKRCFAQDPADLAQVSQREQQRQRRAPLVRRMRLKAGRTRQRPAPGRPTRSRTMGTLVSQPPDGRRGKRQAAMLRDSQPHKSSTSREVHVWSR